MTHLGKFRAQLVQIEADAVLVVNPQNRRYLSGFTGSAGALLISKTMAVLVTDFRYWEQAAIEAPEFTINQQTGDFWKSLAELIRDAAFKSVAFEGAFLSFADYQKLSKLLGDINLVPLTDEIDRCRWIKDEAELSLIAEAVKITDLAWEKTLTMIKPGITEAMVALEFDYQLRLNGAEGTAFPTIVASGARTALPHAAATDKKLQAGELLLLDGGALYRGYHGDMTRTVVLGGADEKQKQLYKLVLEAQQRALVGLHAGLTGKEGDQLARGFLVEAGYGDYFGHGLGHSVGLEIHERPRLSLSEPAIIPAGAAITVEPGVYLPGWGGVRIEDLVIITADGLDNLTRSPKERLQEI